MIDKFDANLAPQLSRAWNIAFWQLDPELKKIDNDEQIGDQICMVHAAGEQSSDLCNWQRFKHGFIIRLSWFLQDI